MSSMAQGSRPSERVLVIGLDGATFRLIDPWVAESRLPVLDRLLRTGVRARLRSTVQAESATAWATMITGVNLAKHGIYAFVHRERATGRLQVINATHLRAERIWDILGRHGRQVVVINVPITYPPSQVNGMLVSGMLTPDLNRTFTYPPELGKELLAKVPGYTITVDRAAYLPGSKGEDLFLTELARSIEKRQLCICCKSKRGTLEWSFLQPLTGYNTSIGRLWIPAIPCTAKATRVCVHLSSISTSSWTGRLERSLMLSVPMSMPLSSRIMASPAGANTCI